MTTHAFRLPPRIARLLAIGVCAFCGIIQSRAEPTDLTDLLGRTIRAELISLEGDALTIRREDGRDFVIELKSLSDDDQAKVVAWNKKRLAEASDAFASAPVTKPAPDAPDESKTKPAPKYVPDMGKITLAMSRFKGSTTTISKFEGYSHKHEQWGYSLQINNRNLYPVENIRIEYNLLARTFYDSNTPDVVTGSIDLPPVGSNRSEGVKTKTAEVCKQRGIYTYNTGGELRGVWVKIYVDGELIKEQASPESIKDTTQWKRPAPERD